MRSDKKKQYIGQGAIQPESSFFERNYSIRMSEKRITKTSLENEEISIEAKVAFLENIINPHQTDESNIKFGKNATFSLNNPVKEEQYEKNKNYNKNIDDLTIRIREWEDFKFKLNQVNTPVEMHKKVSIIQKIKFYLKIF